MWQAKDLREGVFGRMAVIGVSRRFFGCAARKEISEERWNVARSESWNVEGEDNSPKLKAGGDGEAREGLQWQIWRWWSREFRTHDTTYYYIVQVLIKYLYRASYRVVRMVA